MTYVVDWLEDAENEFASLWLQSSDRQAITTASNVLDQRLRLDPENEGESRPQGRRILFCKPLGIYFRVLRDQRLVQVLHVWEY
jgi:hypothetical protein